MGTNQLKNATMSMSKHRRTPTNAIAEMMAAVSTRVQQVCCIPSFDYPAIMAKNAVRHSATAGRQEKVVKEGTQTGGYVSFQRSPLPARTGRTQKSFGALLQRVLRPLDNSHNHGQRPTQDDIPSRQAFNIDALTTAPWIGLYHRHELLLHHRHELLEHNLNV